jgi:hypothetical protein
MSKKVILIFTLGLFLRFIVLLYNPPFNAPDERAHFNYVSYLYNYHSLPIRSEKADSPSNDWEFTQPPLYYLLLQPNYFISQSIPYNTIPSTVLILRLSSLFLWFLTFYTSYKILLTINLRNTLFETIFLSLIAFLPTYLFISSSISTDNLVTCLSTIIVYLFTKYITLKNSLFIGLFFGLFLYTKLSALLFLPILLLFFFISVFTKKITFKDLISHLFLSILLPLASWLPWIFRHLSFYHSLFPFDTIIKNSTNIYEAINFLIILFWAVSGIYNNNIFLPTLSLFLTLFLFIIFIFCVINKSIFKFISSYKMNFIVSIFTGIMLNIFSVLRFGLLYSVHGQWAQGRLLFPMLIPICLFISMTSCAFFRSKPKLVECFFSISLFAYAFLFVFYTLTN